MDFSEKCQNWIDTPAAERNLESGAMLMLMANRNRILYQNVLYRKNFERIEFEIKKYLASNPYIPTAEKASDITALEHKLAKAYDPFKDEKKGYRADHEELPEQIKNIFELNREQYHVLRSVHEKLKVLSGANYNADQRKPLIEQLFSISDKIRKNWKLYDNYNGEKIEENKNEPENTGSNLDFKQVNANKVYLSRCDAQIKAMREKGKDAEAETLVMEARKRYEYLLKAGVTFKPKMIEKLTAAGVII